MSRVTILLPTYNNQKRIKYTLNSLINQSYHEFQILVIDDNSIDDTVNIIKQYSKKFTDFYIIEKNKNLGLADSLNIGLKEAKYDLIIRHDAEDISHKDRVSTLLKEYYNSPGVSCITTACFLLFSHYHFIGYVPIIKIKNVNILLDFNINRIYHASVLYNKKHVIEAGYYPNMRAAQDYALWKKMHKMKMKFKFIDKPLYAYFRENIGISSNIDNMQLINRFNIDNRNFTIEDIRDKKYKQALKNHIVFDLPFNYEKKMSPYYLFFLIQKYIKRYNMHKYSKYIRGFCYNDK